MRISGVGGHVQNIGYKSSRRSEDKSGKSEIRDQYIHADILTSPTYEKATIKKKCPDSSIDIINFNTESILKQKRETVESIFVNNEEYLKKDLPRVDYSRCCSIKANKNRIILNNMSYYGYQDRSGLKHVFSCANNRLEQPYSDLISGRQNNKSYQICKFWNMLSRDGTYIGLYYSQEEQKQLLNDAGITKGFFSVEIGENKQEYFFSNGNAGVTVRQFEYDATYDMFVKRGTALFNKYEVGSVFKIGGKEYVLNEQRKLDIPYGEDIFDIEFPKMSTID